MPQKRDRPRFIQTYFPDEAQYQEIRRAAFDAEQNLSEYVRQAVLERLRRDRTPRPGDPSVNAFARMSTSVWADVAEEERERREEQS